MGPSNSPPLEVAPKSLAPPFHACDLRPFCAQCGDLDVDFGAPNRQALVSDILRRCVRDGAGREVPIGVCWALPIGRRLEALLDLVALSDNRAFTAAFPCSGCGQTLESELSLSDLIEHQRRLVKGGPVAVRVANAVLELKLPTGDDLRRWEAAPVDETRMIRELVVDRDAGDRVLGQGEIPDAWRAAVDDAMASADPLVDFRLLSSCPDCGAETEIGFDLQRFALERLEQRQRRLLDEIHLIASAYHWSEAELVALTPVRRAQYLARIRKGL